MKESRFNEEQAEIIYERGRNMNEGDGE